MALIRFQDLDPVRHLLALQQELDRFQRNPGFNLGPSGYGTFPAVNLFEDRDGMVVMAELPGVEPESINISSQSRTLTISGERRRESLTDSAGYHRRERAHGEFSRSIQLPETVDLAKAAASCTAGVLTVRIPKAEAAKPRQITVQSR
jgi:HSP20 family protein